MWSSAVLLFGAWCAFERNDLALGKHFRELLGDVAESGTPFEVSAYHAVRFREAMTRGDFAAALSAVQLSLDTCLVVGFPYGEASSLLNMAYLAFELGQLDRAYEALARLKRMEDEQGDPVLTFWRLLIEADRSLFNGNRLDATELLRRAFQIGRERQVYGMHSPTKERLADLCKVALTEEIEVDYAGTLVRRRRLIANPPPSTFPIGRGLCASDARSTSVSWTTIPLSHWVEARCQRFWFFASSYGNAARPLRLTRSALRCGGCRR